MTTKMVFHGSDIEKICAYYHLNKEDIVKFGANVNPLGLSASVKKEIAENIDLFSSYPDRDYVSLRNTIAAYCQIPAEFILPGNGSSELISLLIQERAPKHTLILGPTYSEYSRELSFSGSTQEYYHLQEERNFSLDVDDLCKTLEKGYDFLIICNPNNPTSSAIMQEDLRKLIAFCSGKNIFVMIDETYVEFAPDINAVTAVPLTREFTNLMVLRGVSKFYAAPGMRLGYGITGNREFLAKMKEKQTPWSLNSLGAFAGKKMLLDHDYFRRTRELILGERDRMETELKKLPIFKVYPAYANFILNRPDYKCSVPGLREKVWSIAMEMNYVPNEAARNLKKGTQAKESKIWYINVLMTRTDESRTDPFFTELLRVVESEIHEHNCILSKVWYMPLFSDDRKCRRENLDQIIQRMYTETEENKDGLIICCL